jgi:hypothetical protein
MVGAILTLAIAADLFVPVAGNTRSATGLEFRTTVWITNTSNRATFVRVTFLERHPLQAASKPLTVGVAPHETKELADLPLALGRQGVVGALRFESAEAIAVAARIYSSDGTGEGLSAIAADAGLQHGEEGIIAGVNFDGVVRQTTYFIETSGRPTGVYVSVRDAAGREVAHDSFLLEAYEHRSLPITEVVRKTPVRNGSMLIRATGGSGYVYAIGLQILNAAGDGYFVEMKQGPRRKSGPSEGELLVYSLTALAVIAAVAADLYRRKSAKRA